MSKVQMVEINPNRLKNYAEKNGGSQSLSILIGRGRTYINNVVSTGKISRISLDMLCKVTGVPEEFFTTPDPNPEAPKPAAPDAAVGYELHLKVRPEKVYIMLSHNGSKVESAYAKVKGDTELDLIKSISYAAHMMYKNAEQRYLEGETE